MVFVCCVPSCDRNNDNAMMHRFPKDREMCLKWLNLIGRLDLLGRDMSSIRTNYRVCTRHFSEDFKWPENKLRSILKQNSFPSLFLPGTVITETSDFMEIPDVDIVMSCEPEYSIISQKDALISLPGIDISVPSTSKDITPGAHLPENPTDSQDEALISLPVNDPMPISKRNLSTPVHMKKTLRQRIMTSPRTPKRRIDIRNRRSFLETVGVTRATQLTPKAHKLYSIAKGLKQTAKQIDIDRASFKERLQQATEYAESSDFFQSKVNPATFRFITTQINFQTKKARGRRFTMEDKIWALSLMKQSPKGYKLLKNTFALPSRRTLTKLLSKVPFFCGMNTAVLKSLQKSVAKMDPLDRTCCLLFDEMSLEVALNYNKKEDIIEGFKNCGGEEKSNYFADHAIVFMARGIKRIWKQPIAYFFSESGLSAPDIVRNIKMIIKQLRVIGLNVVATVCDQLSINGSAIKTLRRETEREHALKGIENKMFGFSIDGQEVIPLFDTPHLLKGMRNNFLDGSVKFTWKGAEQTANWSDIIALYELDVGDHDCKMVNKLTSSHVYGDKMKNNESEVGSSSLFPTRFGRYERTAQIC